LPPPPELPPHLQREITWAVLDLPRELHPRRSRSLEFIDRVCDEDVFWWEDRARRRETLPGELDVVSKSSPAEVRCRLAEGLLGGPHEPPLTDVEVVKHAHELEAWTRQLRRDPERRRFAKPILAIARRARITRERGRPEKISDERLNEYNETHRDQMSGSFWSIWRFLMKQGWPTRTRCAITRGRPSARARAGSGPSSPGKSRPPLHLIRGINIATR